MYSNSLKDLPSFLCVCVFTHASANICLVINRSAPTLSQVFRPEGISILERFGVVHMCNAVLSLCHDFTLEVYVLGVRGLCRAW